MAGCASGTSGGVGGSGSRGGGRGRAARALAGRWRRARAAAHAGSAIACGQPRGRARRLRATPLSVPPRPSPASVSAPVPAPIAPGGGGRASCAGEVIKPADPSSRAGRAPPTPPIEAYAALVDRDEHERHLRAILDNPGTGARITEAKLRAIGEVRSAWTDALDVPDGSVLTPRQRAALKGRDRVGLQPGPVGPRTEATSCSRWACGARLSFRPRSRPPARAAHGGGSLPGGCS